MWCTEIVDTPAFRGLNEAIGRLGRVVEHNLTREVGHFIVLGTMHKAPRLLLNA